MAFVFGAVLLNGPAFGVVIGSNPNCNNVNYSCTDANKNLCTCEDAESNTSAGPHTKEVQYCSQTFDLSSGAMANYWRCKSGAYYCGDGYYGVKKSTGGMMTQGGPPTELAECKPCPGKANDDWVEINGQWRLLSASEVHSKTTSYGRGYAGISDCYISVSGIDDEYGIWESVGECAYVPD